MYPIIELFGRSYHTYHLFFLTSIFAASYVFFYFDKKANSIIDKLYLISICFVVGVISSKVFFFFEDIHMPFSRVFDFTNGYVFYGGFFGVILALYLRYYGEISIFKSSLDSLSISASFGMFLGKIGCFFAGCCFGYPSESFFGIYFTKKYVAAYNPFCPLFPIQLVDSLLNFVLLLILLAMRKRANLGAGKLFLTFIILYSLSRFITEFYRADISRGILFEFISLSQLYSVLVVFLVIGYYLIKFKSS